MGNLASKLERPLRQYMSSSKTVSLISKLRKGIVII
jgi:hypothetical protein